LRKLLLIFESRAATATRGMQQLRQRQVHRHLTCHFVCKSLRPTTSDYEFLQTIARQLRGDILQIMLPREEWHSQL